MDAAATPTLSDEAIRLRPLDDADAEAIAAACQLERELGTR
jgi:hypothetical protein